ncbi:DEHA2G02068p [Debaryomyces hansenii CBS767]|jgi:hypothetical protein|uniref:DEHA2G02068p n=1 Tax=Debaryomyces hansenii (strain ATCC 36239 / CBS 767 / BCRC 21394 / JCM 1990 / NBRC 0083 / IGC 2968) TaxID=284592 RepID=Q6BJJ0_DEBHA|nr:DEHA2G02068p [Debaryomyces hansenii CBS767]CAG90079.1 DEHA2G02068p [Debaryomyces hansenii CBS767]|eukprot:XP_461631.1 DEHA2G02068p [Debaryomyces hansenii CBS767]
MPFTKFADYFNTTSKNSEDIESKNSYKNETSNQSTDGEDLESTVTNTGNDTDHNKGHHRHIKEEKFHQSSDNLIVGL